MLSTVRQLLALIGRERRGRWALVVVMALAVSAVEALATLLVGDGQPRHVTAEGLYAAAQENGDGVSLATVYNTLRAFCEAGLVNEITVDATRSYFDTCVEDHPHYFWEDTQELTDAPSGAVAFSRLPDPPQGAEISRVDVVIRLRRV